MLTPYLENELHWKLLFVVDEVLRLKFAGQLLPVVTITSNKSNSARVRNYFLSYFIVLTKHDLYRILDNIPIQYSISSYTTITGVVIVVVYLYRYIL